MKINITEDEMTSLVDKLNDLTDFVYKKNAIEITQELIDKAEGDIPQELLGFTLQLTDVDGDHRNDGQMVDYTFTFESQTGKETDIETEMCLMVGWNFSNYDSKGYDIAK